MITVFGSCGLDLIANVPRLPAPGETVLGGVFGMSPGGKGANQAMAVKRSGRAVRFAGAVGNDDFAPRALELHRPALTVDAQPCIGARRRHGEVGLFG